MASPPRRRDSRPAIEFLRHDDRLAAMLPAAERMLRLRQDLSTLVPATLQESCDIASFDDEIVALRVASASAAAKLRQTLPRLVDGLVGRGWKVNAIRIRVQPPQFVDKSTSWRAHDGGDGPALPLAAVDAFERLSGHLVDSPLRAAVARLVARRRG